MTFKSATYEDLVDKNPLIKEYLPEKRYAFIGDTSDLTTKIFKSKWIRNAKKNLKLFYHKHGMLCDNCQGFAQNKATIGIGAGPSLKKNFEYLRRLNWWNSKYPFHKQPFLFICSNHQFKPCLEEGLIPHFVLIVDEGTACIEQFKSISHRGQHVTLLASLHVSPEITMDWDRHGRLIQFYLPLGDDNKREFERVAGKGATEGMQIMQGGNVLNVAWMMSMVMGGTVFMGVGNDLSYPIKDNIDETRKAYYADGNYSSNIKSRRDEASRQYKWMGFEITDNIFTGEPQLNFVQKATVQSLFTYKTWLETQIGLQDVLIKQPWHYYNCSEAGILGVVCRSDDKADVEDPTAWRMLDEVLPNRYHTTKLKTAVESFLAARVMMYEKRQSDMQRCGLPIVCGA